MTRKINTARKARMQRRSIGELVRFAASGSLSAAAATYEMVQRIGERETFVLVQQARRA